MAGPLGPEEGGGGGTGTSGGCGNPSFREPRQPGPLHKPPDRNHPPVSSTQSEHSGRVKGRLRALWGGPVTNWHRGHQVGQGCRAVQSGTWSHRETCWVGPPGRRAAGGPPVGRGGPMLPLLSPRKPPGTPPAQAGTPGSRSCAQARTPRAHSRHPTGTHPHRLSMTGSRGQRLAYTGSPGHARGTPGS